MDQIQIINKKIAEIETKIDKMLYESTKNASDMVSSKNYNLAATSAGKTVEGILTIIYKNSCIEKGVIPKEKLTIDPLLNKELPALNVQIPYPIKKQIEVIQTFRNESAHFREGSSVSENTGFLVLMALMEIVEWYLETFSGYKISSTDYSKEIKQHEYLELLRILAPNGRISNEARIALSKKATNLSLDEKEIYKLEKQFISEFSWLTRQSLGRKILMFLTLLILIFIGYNYTNKYEVSNKLKLVEQEIETLNLNDKSIEELEYIYINSTPGKDKSQREMILLAYKSGFKEQEQRKNEISKKDYEELMVVQYKQILINIIKEAYYIDAGIDKE